MNELNSIRPETSDISFDTRPRLLPVTQPRLKDRASLRMAAAFQALSAVLDVGSVFAAFWLAFLLRYEWELGGRISADVAQSLSTFSLHALVGSILLLLVFPTRGVYQIRHRLSFVDYVPKVVGGYGMVLAGIILLAFFLRFSPSRLMYVYAFIVGTALLLGHRLISSWARRVLLRKGIGVDRVILVGSGENARRLMHAMLGRPDLGYTLLGYIAPAGFGDIMHVATESGVVEASRLGGMDEVACLVADMRADEVIIVGEGKSPSEILLVIDQCRDLVVQFRVVPDLLQISMDRVDISDINGVPTIGVRDASITGWNAVLKRTLDILVAATLLAVLAVPMGVIAVLIRRDSPGGVFFTQERLGQYGVPFTMYKFRCMVEDADQRWIEMVGTVEGADRRLFKDPEDPRLTRVGRVLRKLSLDELPQLINILRGDMSLVGPRPPLPKEVEEYQEWQKQRLLVRPGLTGLWQVNGRSDLSFDEMIQLDLYYAENWSAWLDTKILLRTIPAVLLRRGAY